MISPASGPTMCAPSTRSLFRSTTSLTRVFSSRPVSVCRSGWKLAVIDVDVAVARARVLFGEADGADAAAWLKTAVGTSRWSGLVGLPAEDGAREAHALVERDGRQVRAGR